MKMQRSRDNDRVNIFAIEQSPRIVIRLDRRHHRLHLLVSQRVHVGDGDALDIGLCQRIFQYLLSAIARADQPNANAVVRAQHARIGKRGECDGTGSHSQKFPAVECDSEFSLSS